MHTQLLQGEEGANSQHAKREAYYGLDQQDHVFKDRPVWGQYVDISDMKEQVTWKHILKMKDGKGENWNYEKI